MSSELSPVIETAWLIAQVILGLALIVALIRLVKGPSMPDRVVALDLIGGLALCELVLLAIHAGFELYLDVATAIALLAFLATVALARYLERHPAN